MRPCVRTATLDGYLGLARSARARPGAPAGAASGSTVADLAVPDKWVPAARGGAAAGAVGRPSPGIEDFGLRLAGLRRLSTLGPLSVVLRQEPDLRSALRPAVPATSTATTRRCACGWTRPADLATIRLWFEFGEPAPTRQALELATAALHGIVRELLGPAVGAAVDVLLPPRAGVARRPTTRCSGRGCSSGTSSPGWSSTPTELDAPNTRVRPAAAALRRSSSCSRCRRPARRDGDRAGDGAGGDAAAARPVLDAAGRPQPRA